ncbi:thymidylate kinase-like [Symsagittifera roscoffensis]|uniref:thymidylate kinase-like n=1 Tax=Symsagittifera roscoffensis TaxID=84072 RepID=UPI00307BAED5
MVSNKATARRGMLIVFEGLDKAGKSTQAQKLVTKIEQSGRKVELMKFPDRSTHIGKSINEYLVDSKFKLNDKSIHLLFSANRWEKYDEMKNKLNDGISLVVDRYAFSGVAYTCAKPGFTMQWSKSPDIGLLKPDIVFFMLLNPDNAQHRGDYGAERYEKVEFQKKVLDNFMGMKDETWQLVNAEDSIDSIHGGIVEKYEDVLKNRKENFEKGHIPNLWSDLQ